MKKIQIHLMVLGLTILMTSCDGFLDEKPNKSLLVPETVSEFEALIDNYDRINSTAVLPIIYADDYVTTKSNWDNFSPWVQRAYTWSMTPDELDDSVLDFWILYRKINAANVVLDKISENPDWNSNDINRLKAKSLFWRAHGYFELATLYLPIPGKAGYSDDIKLPYRITGGFGVPANWKSGSEVFPLILSDLQEALDILPDQTPYPTQPSRFAAHALLARVHLYLGNFEQAKAEAEKVLEGNFSLLDYQTLNMDAPFPVSIFNSETVLFSNMAAQSTVSGNNVAFVNPDLVNSFDPNDLRGRFLVRNADGNFYFKGSYISRQDVFSGIALDEIFLLLAEVNTRLGNTAEGLALLNQLLENRMIDFKELDSNSTTQVLDWVLDARRKSLLFRGQRWADMKRLSVLEYEGKTVTRILGDEVVNLVLRQENMVVKIPRREIELQ